MIFLYLLHFTIKSVKHYSSSLVLAKDEIERSQIKYINAYKHAELYKDVFVHDISNMLQNLRFSTDFYYILSDKQNNKEKIQTIINSFESQILRGTELVSNVHLLSKLESEEPMLRLIDINTEIKKLVNEIKKNYFNIDLRIEIDEENQKSVVNADINLSHLFKNIFLNGINHNDNLIKIAEHFYDNHFKIEIIDNGRGLDQQLKQNYSNLLRNSEIEFRSGLGFLVVKRLISIYNGYIFINNRNPDDFTKGTKVVIYLPKFIESI